MATDPKAVAASLRSSAKTILDQADLLDPPVTAPPPVVTPPSPAGFTGRMPVDTTKWKLSMEDDFKSLSSEGQFLKTYGDRWASAGDSDEYLTTSKRGHYDPNHLSVVDLSTGERVLQCRLTPRTSSTGKHTGCGAQIKVNGSGYGMTVGELLQFRCKVLKPASNWHAANLGWPKNWPADGEPDIFECGLSATSKVGANIHVQNGGTTGQGQVSISTATPVTDWFTIGWERMPGDYFKHYVNGQVTKYVKSSDLQAPYGVPKNGFRWMLQLEDSEGGNPTEECIVVYDWVSLWVRA